MTQEEKECIMTQIKADFGDCAVEEMAKTYSFNVESELFPTLNEEQ